MVNLKMQKYLLCGLLLIGVPKGAFGVSTTNCALFTIGSALVGGGIVALFDRFPFGEKTPQKIKANSVKGFDIKKRFDLESEDMVAKRKKYNNAVIEHHNLKDKNEIEYNKLVDKHKEDNIKNIKELSNYKSIVCRLGNGKTIDEKSILMFRAFAEQNEIDQSVLDELRKTTKDVLLKKNLLLNKVLPKKKKLKKDSSSNKNSEIKKRKLIERKIKN